MLSTACYQRWRLSQPAPQQNSHSALCADGGLYLATPVDPLLLALPLLAAARGAVEGDRAGRFCDLEQILEVRPRGLSVVYVPRACCMLYASEPFVRLPCACALLSCELRRRHQRCILTLDDDRLSMSCT